MLSTLLFKWTVGFYLLGTVVSIWSLARRKHQAARYSAWAAGAGFLVHSGALLTRVYESGFSQVIVSRHEALIFFSWALILIFLVIEFRYRLEILGSFILPIAALSILSIAIVPDRLTPLDPGIENVWLATHTTLTVLGLVFFALAFVVGLVYLLEERLLKAKRSNLFRYRMPSLVLLDNLNQWAIYIGFPLLTLGLISGVLLNRFSQGIFFTWDPKQVLTLIIWFFYLAMLHGRLAVGWRAKKAAFLAVIGFVGVVLIFVGVSHF